MIKLAVIKQICYSFINHVRKTIISDQRQRLVFKKTKLHENIFINIRSIMKTFLWRPFYEIKFKKWTRVK